MTGNIQLLRSEVIKAAQDPNFIHHKWYVKYHLEIVEKISLELCDRYPEANKDLVIALVWIHDYGKMIDASNQYNATLTAGRRLLTKLEFSDETIEKILSYIESFDKKEELDKATTPIEIKIVSSADAASHLVGPFYYMWMHENGDKDPFFLMESTIKKANMEWEKKIVLPEVKQAFAARQSFTLELNCQLPSSYL